jgi:hypothetical protein
MGRKLELFITSVQLNEIGKMTDEAKRNRVLSLLSDLAPTKLFVELAPYGYAYGECYGGLSPDSILDHHKFITSRSQTHDAMIAATASSLKYKLDNIVTDDKKFRKKLNSQDVVTKAISYDEFISEISPMAP